jgi:hypothetical protein
MTRSLVALIACFAAVPVHSQTPAAAPLPSTPVAIVARVVGEVTLDTGEGPRRVVLFDRIPAGQSLRTARSSEALIVFRTGARVRVGEASRARIESERAVRLDGTLDALSPVPPIPIVAPVASAGSTLAAVRIRAGGITLLSPPDNTATLAESIVLRYASVATDAYDVEIEGPGGVVVHKVRSRETRIDVPAAAVQPGRVYLWRVSARLATGFSASAEGRFHTLPDDVVQMRNQLRQSLRGEDAESLALLAEVDWTLRLMPDALAGFRAARAAGHHDPVVGERIVQLERRVGAQPTAAKGR